jgi:hypothetical protein
MRAPLLALLALLVGCSSQSEPAGTAGDRGAPCDVLKFVIEVNLEKFQRGEPPPQNLPECRTFAAAWSDYFAPQNGCPYSAIREKYPDLSGPLLEDWLEPCRALLSGQVTPSPLPVRE